MKKLYVCLDAAGDYIPYHSEAGVDFVFTDELEAEDALNEGETVATFVELTPRVRLGLWLAGATNRSWFYRDGAECRVWLSCPGETHHGEGPSLDAAIEDALSKLPAKENP